MFYFYLLKQNYEINQVGQPFSAQPSSFYPTYAFANPFSSQPVNGGVGFNSYGSSIPLSSNPYPTYTSTGIQNIRPYAQAASVYPTYAANPSSYSGDSSGGNLDFHAILDQFVRSAGLTPAGDQDTAASTIQAKGDTPVFSFKKLYSFPFYLSTDNSAQEGYNLQIPFMRKHIRRMSNDKLQYLKQMQDKMKLTKYQQKMQEKKLKQDQQWQQILKNPQAYISQYIQKYHNKNPITLQSSSEMDTKPEVAFPAYFYGSVSNASSLSLPTLSLSPTSAASVSSSSSVTPLSPSSQHPVIAFAAKVDDKDEEQVQPLASQSAQDSNGLYLSAS